MPSHRGGGGGGGGDKKAQFYDAIVSQKLQQVRWGVANAGVAPGTRNDEGLTTFMLAADNGKDRSLAELIRWYERRLNQLRECLTQVEDETGRTCMHMACAHPTGAKAVQELLDAWLRVDSRRRDAGLLAKDNSGKTPIALARGKTKELIDEWLAEDDDDDADETADVANDDGLTSTQRSKLKKKMMVEKERSGVAATDDDDDLEKEDTTIAALSDGAIPTEMPKAQWPEIEAWQASVKNLRPIYEISVAREDEEEDDKKVFDFGGHESIIDPALWWCLSINRLQLKLGPRLTSFPPAGLAKLTNLATLIVSGHSLASLPEIVGDLPLKSMDVSRNKLIALPKDMPHRTLENLDASDNDICDIKESLKECTNLVSLAVDANPRLSDLALPFTNLKRLVKLSASHCAIADLDDNLGALAKLETLTLSDNPLTALPPALANCKKLKDLKVDNTQIKDNKVLGYIQKGEMKQLAKYFEKQGGSSSSSSKKGGGSSKKAAAGKR